MPVVVDIDLPHEISLAQDIIHNAKAGLKTLLSSGIEVIAMSQKSGTKLAEFARRHRITRIPRDK